MQDCLFCKMAAGDIPVSKVYEDDTVLAFHDIDPQAPVHFLVIPKTHIASPGGITPENSAVVAHIFEVIARLALRRYARFQYGRTGLLQDFVRIQRGGGYPAHRRHNRLRRAAPAG